MRWSSLIAIATIGFIITDQFYTAVNYRMLAIAAVILLLVWPDFKRLLLRQYVRLVRGVRFLFTPSKYHHK
ncbi:hypothetical protein [Sporomusa aerivorans]|uniref:hypothetical protein n=1 Tax=Sporomusa aerivorans TaxID=204936 RepID=UPI00352AA022